jgi:hypothetical protein
MQTRTSAAQRSARIDRVDSLEARDANYATSLAGEVRVLEGQAAVEAAAAAALSPAQILERLGECGCVGCQKALAGSPTGPTFLLTTDNVADDTSTTTTITVDDDPTVSTIDTLDDVDFFKVELVEGEVYDIGMYAQLAGPGLTPLPDSYIDLYDADGNLILNADGGKPGDPGGLDALMVYRAQYTGTYFIRASAFDQADTGPGGDGVGDYQLFCRASSADPNSYGYTPYYSPDSPLHSIDWGTQIDGSSRNPDGDQGPRDNGEPFTGTPWQPSGIEGKNVVTFYLAKAGEAYVSESPGAGSPTANMVVARDFTAFEKAALIQAFDQYEEVADLVYIEVQDRYEADFNILSYMGTPGPGASLLGAAAPPDTPNEGQMEFNAADERWNEAGLTQGGFFFSTILHEFGHAHGMAHPHDNGGHSSIMRGAGGTLGGGIGDYGLSQRIYTVMSYNSEWVESPYGNPDDHANYGWVGGLSALDIAVIQDKYGVNEDYRTGDDVYTLKNVNAEGTFFECIWDAGGYDSIVYDGARNSVIDLRDATLQYEQGGGGWISYAYGIHGGFTIANAVTIEAARGGKGDDSLTGNEANNFIHGGKGVDAIAGGAGRDLLKGGGGNDIFFFDGAENSRDVIADLAAGDVIDLSAIDAKEGVDGNQMFRLVDNFGGGQGQAMLQYKAEKDITLLLLDTDGDREADISIQLNGDHRGFSDFVL